MNSKPWVQLMAEPILPCSLNGEIQEDGTIEYIIEIDGNVSYRKDYLDAVQDYIRTVTEYQNNRR